MTGKTLAERILAWYVEPDCRVDRDYKRINDEDNNDITEIARCKVCGGEWDLVKRDNPQDDFYTPPLPALPEQEKHRPDCFVLQAREEFNRC